MQGIPFSVTLAVIFGIIGGAITLMTFIEKVIGLVKTVKAPDTRQNERIAALEAWKADMERYIGNDKRRIDSLEANLSMMMKAQFALLSHAVNGNDVDRLRAVQAEMQDFLTRHGEG